MKKILPLALLAAMSLSCSLYAGSVQAETLDEAVQAALNNHPSIEAAIASRDAARYDRSEQVSGFFPEVSARAAGGRLYGDNSTSRGLSVTRGAGYSYLWEGDLTVTQPLFNGFETVRRIDAAQSRRLSATMNILDVREDLAFRTVVSYLDVMRGRESLARLNKHLETIQDYRNRIRTMVDSGAADETMAVQARDIQVQLENTIANTEGQVAKSVAEYMEVTGHFPDTAMKVPSVNVGMIPADVEEAVMNAKEQHPMLKVAAFSTEAAGFDAKAEEGPLYPDVSGELSYLKRDQADVIGGESIDARALVRVNWNFEVGGAQISRIKSKQKRHFESKAQYEDTVRQMERDIRKAWADMEASKKQLGFLHERVQLNEDLLATNKAQFEGARANLLQLMQANNTLFNAKMALLNGEYRFMASRFSTLANIGRLQESLGVAPVSEQ